MARFIVLAWLCGFATLLQAQFPYFNIDLDNQNSIPALLENVGPIITSGHVTLGETLEQHLLSKVEVRFTEGTSFKEGKAILKIPGDIEVAWLAPKLNDNHGLVGRNEKLEFGLILPLDLEQSIQAFVSKDPGPISYLNPFDPDQLNIEAQFYRMQNNVWVKKHRRFGFYFDDYEYDKTGDLVDWNWEAKSTPYHHRVRYAPPELGNWKCELKVVVNNTVELDLETVLFKVVDSSKPSFLVVAEDKQHYKRDGEYFFPIGINLPRPKCHHFSENGDPIPAFPDCHFLGSEDEDYRDLKLNTLQSYDIYLQEIDTLVKYGGDFFRMLNFPTTYEIEFEHLNDYSERMDRAWELDRFVNKVEQEQMVVNFCLSWGSEFRNAENSYFRTYWNWYADDAGTQFEDNGYCYHNELNLAEPFDFLTSEEAKTFYKKKLRYQFSRWMYSPAISMVEIIQEPEILFETFDNQLQLKRGEWFIEMAGYAKEELEYQGLMRMQYASDDNKQVVKRDLDVVFQSGIFDINALNYYGQLGERSRLPQQIKDKYYGNTEYPDFHKPLAISEMGLFDNQNECDTAHTDWFYGIWHTAFFGSPGIGASWYQQDDWRLDPPYWTWATLGQLRTFLGNQEFIDYPVRQGDISKDTRSEMTCAHNGENLALGVVSNSSWNYYSINNNPNHQCVSTPFTFSFENNKVFSSVASHATDGLFVSGLDANSLFIQSWYNCFTGELVEEKEMLSDGEGNLWLDHPTLEMENPLMAFKIFPKTELVVQGNDFIEQLNSQTAWGNNKEGNSVLKIPREIHKTQLFPNPSPGKAKLHFQNSSDLKLIFVFNTRGKRIMNYGTQENSFSLPSQFWPTGTYFIEVMTNGASEHFKFFKL